MAVIKADADALESQGLLHQQIAQFYRDAAGQMQQHGQNVVNEFQQWQASHADQYRDGWLHPSVAELQAEADKHDGWHTFFMNLAQDIRTAERQLTGDPPPVHGHGRVPIAQ